MGQLVKSCMMTGSSIEEFLNLDIDVFFGSMVDNEENKNSVEWYKHFKTKDSTTLTDDEDALKRYHALTPFQQLVFDRIEVVHQQTAKLATDSEWAEFIKDCLTWQQPQQPKSESNL